MKWQRERKRIAFTFELLQLKKAFNRALLLGGKWHFYRTTLGHNPFIRKYRKHISMKDIILHTQ